MELRELIAKTHECHQALKDLQTKQADIQAQLEAYEAKIKTRLDEKGEDYANLTEAEFQLLMADLGDPKKLAVEVVYATQDQQFVNEIQLSRGATIEDSIVLSGILDKCTEINLGDAKVGIHGVIKPLTQLLADGDRVEIYRPITAKI